MSGEMREQINKVKNWKQFLNENKFNNVIYRRKHNNNIEAILEDEVIGEVSLYDYWSELSYIEDDEIKNEIEIPENYEFVGMIDSDIQNKGIATNMLRYAMDTTKKTGISISKLFIADQAVHSIMKKLNAIETSDWYLLKN